MSRCLRVARPALLWLATLAALCALGLLAPGQAHAASTTAHRACTANAGGEYLQPISKTWVYHSTCPSSTHSYNLTYCVYKFNVGNGWVKGPVRTGNGSVNSNFSEVSCTAHGSGNPYHIQLWFDLGTGWQVYKFR